VEKKGMILMVHSYLSNQQLDEIEERYRSLQKLVTIDVEALIKEVRAYKQLAIKAKEVKGKDLPVSLSKTLSWTSILLGRSTSNA
jgi:hypothetical protein